MTELLQLFAMMVMRHCLADYPLQGDFLARAKSRAAPLPGIPWPIPMAAHALIHAGFVWLITGVWWLGVIEFVAHFVIDDCKCTSGLSFARDQVLHVGLKALYVIPAAGAWR